MPETSQVHDCHEVVSPLGDKAVAMAGMAPRLDSLDGKTIGEIWNGGFRGDESFPLIRKILQERFPTLKIIPYSEFTIASISSMFPDRKQQTLEKLSAEIRAKGCDAIITGNGC